MPNRGDPWEVDGLYDDDDFVVRTPEGDPVTEAAAIDDLPTEVVRRTSETEINRRFIVFTLTATLCIAVLAAVVAVLFRGVDSTEAVTVLAPLATLVTAVVTYYFSKGDK